MLTIRQIAAVSAIGCALFRALRAKIPQDSFLHNTSYLLFFSVVFSSLFLIKFIYHVFIYPTFLSPLRHLPSPKEEKYLRGHLGEIHKYGFAHMARKWYVYSVIDLGFFVFVFLYLFLVYSFFRSLLAARLMKVGSLNSKEAPAYSTSPSPST